MTRKNTHIFFLIFLFFLFFLPAAEVTNPDVPAAGGLGGGRQGGAGGRGHGEVKVVAQRCLRVALVPGCGVDVGLGGGGTTTVENK